MYRDKDRQREAVREANRRYRAKGITRVSRASELNAEFDGVSRRVSREIPEMPSVWGGPKDYEGWSPEVPKMRPAVKAVIEKRGPVPDWRAQKDAQMARFLKGVK